MNKPRYLLVGGGGYFGARLATSLNGSVVVTQRRSSESRNQWARAHGIQLVNFDSAHGELPVRGEFDAVFNLAAPSAAEAAALPDQAASNAHRVVRECMKLLRTARLGRMIHFSSFHVYGASDKRDYSEDDVLAPSHAYGRIHAQCEELVLTEGNTIVVRPSNLVGCPGHRTLGEQAKLLFLDLCRQAIQGRIALRSNGLGFRDFLPFQDAIDATKILLTKVRGGDQVFNMASGNAIRLDSVAEMISKLREGCTVEFGNDPDSFQAPFCINVSRLTKLGWNPQLALKEETRRILRFFEDSGSLRDSEGVRTTQGDLM